MFLARFVPVLFVLIACTKAAEPAPVAPASPAASSNAPVASERGSAGGVTWEHQAPLVRRAPKSSMRVAEYGVEGDALTELTVFYFEPDQGGSVDANVTRWLGQLQQPDGSDTAAKAKRTTSEISGIAVTQIEATGNFSGGMPMPGTPTPAPIADAMLLGAIAAGPSGPVFFKLIGPAQTVEKTRASFEQLIASLRK